MEQGNARGNQRDRRQDGKGGQPAGGDLGHQNMSQNQNMRGDVNLSQVLAPLANMAGMAPPGQMQANFQQQQMQRNHAPQPPPPPPPAAPAPDSANWIRQENNSQKLSQHRADWWGASNSFRIFDTYLDKIKTENPRVSRSTWD